MNRHLRRWGAVYLLFLLFLGSWIGQFFAQMWEFKQERPGASLNNFLPKFFASTLENWQSEWLQLVVQAALLLGMKHLIFRADAEDEERLETKLDRLLERNGIDPQTINQEVARRRSNPDRS